ncbi:MAG: guanylate kinase [Chlorobiales bacterium]|jgi:guanylate kinase|nr:guanylate kinase [Chlorobiales bacterium]
MPHRNRAISREDTAGGSAQHIKPGKLIVFSAPSGTGKSTIAKRILSEIPNLGFSISATTRAMRPGEADGREYYFLSKEIFEKKIQDNAFIEYENFFGNFYGTLKDKTEDAIREGRNLLFDLDVKGAISLKHLYGNQAVLIFISPPSMAALKARLTERRESDDEIKTRLARAEFELSFASQFDHNVINDDLEKAVAEVKQLILTAIQN